MFNRERPPSHTAWKRPSIFQTLFPEIRVCHGGALEDCFVLSVIVIYFSCVMYLELQRCVILILKLEA